MLESESKIISNNPEAVITPTKEKPGLNQVSIRCGMCGDLYYVDEATKARIAEVVETGLDNPFRCEDCESEYDDLAYEG